MALSTARIHKVRGRPPLLAAGIRSLIHSHSSSVRSLGYIFSFIYPFYTTHEDFSDRLLEELTQTAATLGVEISPQALDQRFTRAAAMCVKQVLDAALTRVITADPVAIPLLARFTAVAVQDSSTIVLPDALAAVWPGCGGSTPESTSAALKLQVRLDLRTGCLAVQFQDGRASDRTADWPGSLPAG